MRGEIVPPCDRRNFVQHKLWRDQWTALALALETKLARFQGERYRVASGHGAASQDHGRLVRPGGRTLVCNLSIANKQILAFDKREMKSIRERKKKTRSEINSDLRGDAVDALCSQKTVLVPYFCDRLFLSRGPCVTRHESRPNHGLEIFCT